MSLLYAYEKLSAGVTVLATHPGRIKERLIAAFHESLVLVPAKSLPPEASKLWNEIWPRVTALKGSPEAGAFRPSIEALDVDDVVSIAKKLVTIETMVESAVDQHSAER